MLIFVWPVLNKVWQVVHFSNVADQNKGDSDFTSS